MGKKKDAYWFSHDSNAKDDPKCMLLVDQLGLEGYGIYWVLVETLREQPEYRYPIKLLPILARRYYTSSEKMLTVVKNFGLFEIENDEFFYSSSLVERMLPLEEKRAKTKRAAETRWKKQKESSQSNDADAMQMYSTCNSDVMLSKVKESKIEESKIEEIREKEISPFDFEKAFNEYKDYLQDEIVQNRLAMKLSIPLKSIHLVINEFLETRFANIAEKSNKFHVEQYFGQWVEAKDGRVTEAINKQLNRNKHEQTAGTK